MPSELLSGVAAHGSCPCGLVLRLKCGLVVQMHFGVIQCAHIPTMWMISLFDASHRCTKHSDCLSWPVLLQQYM